MPHRRIRSVLLLQGLFKDFHMNITQALDFFSGQALIHQGLFHFGDFSCFHPFDQLVESLFDRFKVFTIMQGLDNFLECHLLFHRVADTAVGPVRCWFSVFGGCARLPVDFFGQRC